MENIRPSQVKVQREPINQVKELVPLFKRNNIKKILDRGCKTDKNAKYISDEDFYVVGLDNSTKSIKYLEQRYEETNNLEVIKSGMDKIHFLETTSNLLLVVLLPITPGKNEEKAISLRLREI